MVQFQNRIKEGKNVTYASVYIQSNLHLMKPFLIGYYERVTEKQISISDFTIYCSHLSKFESDEPQMVELENTKTLRSIKTINTTQIFGHYSVNISPAFSVPGDIFRVTIFTNAYFENSKNLKSKFALS